MKHWIVRCDEALRGLVQWASGRRWRSALVIAVLACAVTLPGLSTLPVTDRDEARYAQASKQMMETGDYIDIRNLDAPRWKKPAGIYWLQVASAKVFGDGPNSHIWAYRLPSALGIIAAALLTWWALLPLLGAKAALVAGLATASTATTAVEANIAKTDAVLLACCALVFGALVRLFQERDRPFGLPHILLWAGIGLGFLVKGPIVLIPFLGALIWCSIAERNLSLLKSIAPLPGLAVFAAIAAPWYIAIAIKTDGAFFAESLGKDLLGKVAETAENHGGPPGYYLGTLWVTFWPWAPLGLLALPMIWADHKRSEIRLLLGWIIPVWAVFALASTKLPHYILPALPALAAVFSMGLTETGSKTWRVIAAALFIFGAVVAGVFAFGPLPVLDNEWPTLLLLSGALATLGVGLAVTALLYDQRHVFAGFGVLSLLLIVHTLTTLTAPRLDEIFLSPRLVAEHDQFEACVDQPLVSLGYQEMSLAFLAGTDTKLATLNEAADHLKTSQGALVFLRLDEPDLTQAKLEAKTGLTLQELSRTEGTNYNSGREVTIVQLAREDAPSLEACKTD